MIRRITENIQSELIKAGLDMNQIQQVGQAITLELGKYDITEKVTAITLRDNSDMEIIARYFLAKATAGLSQRSLKYYRFVIERAMRSIGKNIKKITSDDIRCYLTRLRVQGVKLSSVDNERRVLSSLFTWAFNEEMIPKNPCIRVAKVKIQKVVRKPLTEDEMEMIRIHSRTERNRAIIEFLYSTGCRVSEVVALNRADIDLNAREAVVLGKGNKERKVFISPRCVATLNIYLNSRKDNNPALFVSDFDGFKGDDARRKKLSDGVVRLGVAGIESMVKLAGKRAGIEDVHPHRIRRTAATFALRRGMPIEQVSKMLGHESLETTTIYANSTMDEVKQSHDKYLV